MSTLIIGRTYVYYYYRSDKFRLMLRPIIGWTNVKNNFSIIVNGGVAEFFFFFQKLETEKSDISLRLVLSLSDNSEVTFWGNRWDVRLDFVRQFELTKSCLTTIKSWDVGLGFSLTNST